VPTLKRLVVGRSRPPTAEDFRPVDVIVVELEKPEWEARLAPSGPDRDVWALVRLHGRPLGEVQLEASEHETNRQALIKRVRELWGEVVDQHLRSHAELTRAEHQLAGWETCLEDPLPDYPTVSVVVPTCRRPDAVRRCVESLVATGYPGLEILVVDNAPGEGGTAAAVAEVPPGDYRIAYLAEPVPGASRARNRGVAAASGEVIAFVDDDIVVDRLWVRALVEALARRPQADCVTGLVIPDRLDTAIHLWFEQAGGFNRGYTRRSFDVTGNRGDTLLYPYTAGALGGLGNCAFRRTALETRAAFEVTLGPGTAAFGAEDLDAFVSLLRGGGELLYEPSALVRHSHRDSWGDLRWQMFTYGAGMVAGLVHWGWTDRSVAVELGRRIVTALPQVLRGGNRQEALQSVSDDCPPELRMLERLGYVYGPVAYVRAVRARRQIDRRST
jgi:hypothetical protein